MRGAMTARVSDLIRTQAADGTLAPGRFIPSERVLAETCGVSRVTVRRALDELVQEGLLAREPCKGYRLCAQTDGHAEQAKPIVILHSLSEQELVRHGRHAAIWAGAQAEADRTDLLSAVCRITKEEMSHKRAANLAAMAGGVLCDCQDRAYLSTLLDAGISVVLIDYHQLPGLLIDAVVQDDAGGIAQAVLHLYEHGHRRIGYVDTSEKYRAQRRALNAEQRLAGFKAATGQLGIADACTALACSWNAREMMETFLRHGVTALIFPHTDFWADMYAEFERRAISVPVDLGVVVWGAELEPDNEIPCPTSITWSKQQMGREAVRRLVLRLRGGEVEPATIAIPCRIIDRGTGGQGPVPTERNQNRAEVASTAHTDSAANPAISRHSLFRKEYDDQTVPGFCQKSDENG